MVTILSPAWFQFVPAVCMMVNCKARNAVFMTMLLEVADKPLGQLTTSVRAGEVTEKSALPCSDQKGYFGTTEENPAPPTP